MIMKDELLVFEGEEKFQPGMYNVFVAFRYNVTGDLAGLYKSTYTTESGQNRTMLTTQMEALGRFLKLAPIISCVYMRLCCVLSRCDRCALRGFRNKRCR